jgi:predicted transcriptional regulator of viral defense system
MVTRIDIAKPDIASYFSAVPNKVYRSADLKRILREHRDSWRLTQAFSANQFTDFLLSKTPLQKVVLESKTYPNETRFVWGSASDYQIALSLKPNSYLSHGTAVFLHALNDQIPATIYVNHEQSPKHRSNNVLSQEAVHRVFKSQQRQSQYVFTYNDKKILLVSGKYTGRLEVGELRGPQDEQLPVTRIERTLIDIAVRPTYAGGPHQVLEAYRRAKERVSVNTLAATLKKLDYLYPYHQVIGFYMERAGYDSQRLARIEKFEKRVDFYLSYGLQNPEYSKRWRLFYPQGL